MHPTIAPLLTATLAKGVNVNSTCAPSLNGSVVRFSRLADGVDVEWKALGAIWSSLVEPERLADRALELLIETDGEHTRFGFQLNVFEHSLQTATRAYRDGASEEMVVVALLHDVGEATFAANHGELAAAMLRPFVSPESYFVLKYHDLFQGHWFAHAFGLDRNARDRLRSSPHYETCRHFTDAYDQEAFDPAYDSLPLEFFEPMVRRLFARDQYALDPANPKNTVAWKAADLRPTRDAALVANGTAGNSVTVRGGDDDGIAAGVSVLHAHASADEWVWLPTHGPFGAAWLSTRWLRDQCVACGDAGALSGRRQRSMVALLRSDALWRGGALRVASVVTTHGSGTQHGEEGAITRVVWADGTTGEWPRAWLHGQHQRQLASARVGGGGGGGGGGVTAAWPSEVPGHWLDARSPCLYPAARPMAARAVPRTDAERLDVEGTCFTAERLALLRALRLEGALLLRGVGAAANDEAAYGAFVARWLWPLAGRMSYPGVWVTQSADRDFAQLAAEKPADSSWLAGLPASFEGSPRVEGDGAAPLELHTDSSFLSEPFGFIAFTKVRHTCDSSGDMAGDAGSADGGVAEPEAAAGACGGETVLLDGLAVSEALRAQDPAAHALLASVSVPWVYRPGDGQGYYMARAPVLKLDSDGRLLQLRWSNKDRGVFDLDLDLRVGLARDEGVGAAMAGAEEVDEAGQGARERQAGSLAARWLEAYGQLARLIVEGDHTRTVALTAGDVLLVDNHRYLHGRRAYRGARRLLGVYGERADVDALQRMLEAEEADGGGEAY